MKRFLFLITLSFLSIPYSKSCKLTPTYPSLDNDKHLYEKEETISFGDMDSWITRIIQESTIIGGKTKLLYEIGPSLTIQKNEAYVNMKGSPWATSNVMAKVSGITKTNTCVFPEKRGNGNCARMETKLEGITVFGLINLHVLAAGTIFLGSIHEPITGMNDPQKKINSGIPFDKKPKAIYFDYKVTMSGSDSRIYSTGISPQRTVAGRDYPAAILLLQKRWEDSDGKIYAQRIGTMVIRFDKTTSEWKNAVTFPILYGNITNLPQYKDEWMRIQVEERYAINSKGESVPIHEIGWGDAEDTPTHMILQFTSSHGGAYVGSPGNILWVDNIGFTY